MSAARVGLIADSHGLSRPEAIAALRGSDLIIHAGDLGDPSVLEPLRALAPVIAVRGNIDHGPWAQALPETATVAVAGITIHVLHDVATLRLDPAARGIGVVVFGHSHTPSVERRGPVLFVNPGSAGPRRFSLPIAVARLTIDAGRVDAEILPLDIAAAR